MELGKRDFRSWVFFSLHCGRNRRQHISLFWIRMLPSPHSAIHKGKYVCVSVSGPLRALTSSWWVYLTLPRNIWDVSVAISEVKCGNMSRGRGKLDVFSFYELPVRGLTLKICRERKKLTTYLDVEEIPSQYAFPAWTSIQLLCILKYCMRMPIQFPLWWHT